MTEELLDIVDDNDHVIGQESRAIVHQRGLQHRGVHVFLFTDGGKMLIQKRSADRTASPSLLDCSISEHVKAGESYHDGAVRGMREELGVEGIEIERLTKFRMNYGVNDNEISELYQGVVNPELVQFDPVEIESVMYLSMDELRRMLQDDSQSLCGWFVEMLDLYFNGRGKMQVMG